MTSSKLEQAFISFGSQLQKQITSISSKPKPRRVVSTNQPGPIALFFLNFIGIVIGLMGMILAVSALVKVILFCVKWVIGTC